MTYKNRIIPLSGKKNLFLFGARGSGKSLLLKKKFLQDPFHDKVLLINLLDQSLYQSYQDDIGLFYRTVNDFRKDGLVIVDEIQKMPDLLNEVHRLIESSDRRFILTGSSSRKIKAREVNLLGGRAGEATLHPFVPEELGEDFNLNSALRYGLLPIVWASDDRSEKLKDYTRTYLKAEIKEEIKDKNFPRFTRFLEVVGLCHGQVTNFSNIARDAEIKRPEVQEYFSILEDTKLGFFLPAYRSESKVREQKKPKFYLVDPGLARAFKGNFGPVAVEEKGFLFEGLVAQILSAYRDYRGLYEDIYYWSALESQTEVDFLLKKGKKLLAAIEVKAKEKVSDRDYRGLRVMSKLSSVKRRIVVYMGKDKGKTEDGIEILPFETFCQMLQQGFVESSSITSPPKSVKEKAVPLIEKDLFLKPTKISPSFSKNPEEKPKESQRESQGESQGELEKYAGLDKKIDEDL